MEPRMELLLDDHRGIYIPHGFATEWSHAFTYPDDPEGYARDVGILLAGPHAPEWMALAARYLFHDEQHETWAHMLDHAVGRKRLPPYDAGRDGLPYPDVDTPNWGTPNPMAGWRLDQGSAEDGCVRAYHPDDGAAIFGEE